MIRSLILLGLVLPSIAQATAPMVLSHSGRLLAADGVPIEGTVELTVTLYGEDDLATGFWTKDYSGQPVDNGYYAVSLVTDDDGAPLDPDDFADGAVWVGVQVDNVAIGGLQRLGSVPYAMVAGTSETATGGVTVTSGDGGACLRLSASDDYRLVGTPVNCESGVVLGFGRTGEVVTAAEAPLQSCKAYRDHPLYNPALNGDGIYRIDPDGTGSNPPLNVYCDQTTDGGGWTFFAFYDRTSTNTSFFENNLGSYSADRFDRGELYSIGASFLQHVPHTQMMVTEDMPDPTTADAANKLVVYQYAVGHTGFNQGPNPCSGLSGFSYRINTTGAFTAGAGTSSCGANWYPTATNGAAQYLSLLHSSVAGMYWGSYMGGNNSWAHDGWFYAR